jgi:hypothetical protein
MATMCCVGCGGLSLGGRDHTIVDAAGRRWKFEAHPVFGPIVLRANGDPKTRQPGSRSAFWGAWEKWRDQQREAA